METNVIRFPLATRPNISPRNLAEDIDAISKEAYGPPNFELPFLPAFRYGVLFTVLFSGMLTFAILCGLFGPPVYHVIAVTILSGVFLISGALFVAIRILEPKAV